MPSATLIRPFAFKCNSSAAIVFRHGVLKNKLSTVIIIPGDSPALVKQTFMVYDKLLAAINARNNRFDRSGFTLNCSPAVT